MLGSKFQLSTCTCGKVQWPCKLWNQVLANTYMLLNSTQPFFQQQESSRCDPLQKLSSCEINRHKLLKWMYPMYPFRFTLMFPKLSEAVIRRCSVINMSLKISQNSACKFIKKDTLAHVFFCQFCSIFKNTFSYRVPLVADSKRFMKLLLPKAPEAYLPSRHTPSFQRRFSTGLRAWQTSVVEIFNGF